MRNPLNVSIITETYLISKFTPRFSCNGANVAGVPQTRSRLCRIFVCTLWFNNETPYKIDYRQVPYANLHSTDPLSPRLPR